MKHLKKIIGGVIAILVTLLITFNIYNFINLKILKKDLSTVFGYSILEVVSGSMEPTIKVGDMILIDTNEKNYKKGDIVTFYDTTGTFVTHRIVAINDDEMVTKGDNNDSIDDSTKSKKIVGKYLFKIAYLGTIISFIKNPLLLILVLIIGILYCYLISDDEKDKNQTKKKPKTKKQIPKKNLNSKKTTKEKTEETKKQEKEVTSKATLQKKKNNSSKNRKKKKRKKRKRR